jgi:hypothetical protein
MRESFLQLLRGEKPSEVVWTADISYWVDGCVHAGKADPKWQTELGHLELCRDLGCMPYYWYGKFWAAEPRFDGVELITENRGGLRRCTWRTPVGDLIGETAFMEESWSEAPVRYAVQTEHDLDILLFMLARRRMEPVNLADYRQRLELWARYDGVPCLGLPRSPLPAFIVEWAGVEHGALLAMDCPEKVAEALNLMEQQERPVIEAVCALAPPVVHFPDNLSSANLTSFFDQHMAARYRRRLEPLHAAGVRCAVHLDGTVRGLLPKLAQVGFDAVEALTPKPMGDVGLQEIRAVAANETLVLWGGVPGAMFAPPFVWPDMQTHVEKLLECWQDQPFIVGVADQVPPNGDIGLVRQVAKLLAARPPS